MSQFWWDDESAETLGQEALTCALPTEAGAEGAGKRQRIGVLSAPSVWFGLDRLLKRQQAEAETRGEGAKWGAFSLFSTSSQSLLNLFSSVKN